MNRSRKILIVCHCLLNANAKIPPLASVQGVFTDMILPSINEGCGLFQLPCPETSYLGMYRWGMTREQYDTPAFRSHCRKILETPIDQLVSFKQADYEFTGLIGMDHSPNCGVNHTCEGYRGGEIISCHVVQKQIDSLHSVQGKGIFMEELLTLLQQKGIYPELKAVSENASNAEI